MKKLILFLLLFLPSISWATTTSFTTGNDTYLHELSPTTVENSSDPNILSMTKYAVNDRSNTLIKWDLSSLPPNITVSSATITIHQNGTSANTNVIRCYRILRNWIDTQSTWNVYTTSNNWTTAGASGATDVSTTETANQTLTASAGNFSWTSSQLATDVQNIANGVNSNYGWAFFSDTPTSSYHSLDSFEAAGTLPTLSVTYTLNSGSNTSAMFQMFN